MSFFFLLWLMITTLATVYRHIGISLDLLLKLVRIFGSMIYSAVSASSSVGVDIEAEQRCVNSISPIYTLFSLLRLLTTFKWVSQIGAVQRMLCGARKSKALLAFPYEVCFP